MSGDTTIYNYRPIEASEPAPIMDVVAGAIRETAIRRARQMDAIALEALLSTEHGHRDSLHWVVNPGGRWYVHLDGTYEVDAIACAWDWTP